MPRLRLSRLLYAPRRNRIFWGSVAIIIFCAYKWITWPRESISLKMSRKIHPKSSLDAIKRDKIVEMIRHAWYGYEKYAWGYNQVRPVSKTADPSMDSFFGPLFGATIIDSLDTLYLANLTVEYEKAKTWVTTTFRFEGPYNVGLFETNIRFVGGLLSAYALTNEPVFLRQAKNVADKLLPAFKSKTGLPSSRVQLEGETRTGGCTVLAEVGTLSMEFLYLANVTGELVFRDKISAIMESLQKVNKPQGLYYNSINTENGDWCSEKASLGGEGDSFYEYLFKAWLLTSGNEVGMKDAYDKVIDAAFQHMLRTSQGGHKYFAQYFANSLTHNMEHLACFMGGLLALSAKSSRNETFFMEIADAIGETCYQSYNSTATSLGPESFWFSPNEGNISPQDSRYLLRPETVETYFYLWRLTHNQKWRQYGWEMAQALEKYCRAEAGYSGLTDVYQVQPQKDDVQQSFFLAETLKYLFLLFSPDDVLPLDAWVFNTEAHPLPIFIPSWT